MATGLHKGVVAAGLALVYLPVLVTRYAWSDDFPALAGVNGLGRSLWSNWIGNARPVFAVVETAAFSLAGSIPGLVALRAISLICACVLAALLLKVLVDNGAPPVFAAVVAFGAMLLPSMRIWVAWATMMPDVPAAIAAGIASLLIRITDQGTIPWTRIAGATGLLCVALLTYQPAAMFVWVFFAARVAWSSEEWPVLRREAVLHTLAFVSSCVVAFAVAWTTIAITGVELSERASVVAPADVPAKVAWFVTRYLVTGARPFLLDSPTTMEAVLTAGPVLAITAVGLALAYRGPRRERIERLAVLVVLIPLACAPNLLTAEHLIEFKWLTALSITMLIYLARSLAAITELIRSLVPENVGTVNAIALGMAVVLVVVVSTSHVRSLLNTWTTPGGISDRYLRSEVARVPAGTTEVVVVLPDPPFGPNSAWGNTGLLGDYSTPTDLSHAWVPQNHVVLLLHERGFPPDAVEVSLTTEAEAASGTYVIDTRPLLPRLHATPDDYSPL